jgi:FGGY-family pentulose kinase
MIDAHAGGIGSIAITLGYLRNLKNSQNDFKIDDILVLVSGTSACFMSSSKSPKFIEGIWGPYFEAMIPGMYLNEGGQSSCGKLIDTIIQTHPEYENLIEICSREENEQNIYDYLHNLLVDKSKKIQANFEQLTRNLHIYPDYHGNRSPLSDPSMSGQICGLNLDFSMENLALMYLAAVQALAYQTRHIIECLNSHDINPKIITIIGGLGKNKLYLETISDVCQIPVLITDKSDWAVMLGASISGASNYSEYKNLSFHELISNFGRSNNERNTTLIQPCTSATIRDYHNRKFNVYKMMLDDQKKYQNIMNR